MTVMCVDCVLSVGCLYLRRKKKVVGKNVREKMRCRLFRFNLAPKNDKHIAFWL